MSEPMKALVESADYLAYAISRDPNNDALKTALGAVVDKIERLRVGEGRRFGEV